MTFDYAEYQAFVQLMYKHPELRAEVRKLVLSDDILTLPQVVRELSVTVKELAEAQKRTEQRVEELTEAQKRSEERLSRVEARMDGLEERMTRVEQRMDSLESEVQKTRKEVAGLAAAFGSTLEEEAASVVESVMRRKGYRLLEEATTPCASTAMWTWPCRSRPPKAVAGGGRVESAAGAAGCDCLAPAGTVAGLAAAHGRSRVSRAVSGLLLRHPRGCRRAMLWQRPESD